MMVVYTRKSGQTMFYTSQTTINREDETEVKTRLKALGYVGAVSLLHPEAKADFITSFTPKGGSGILEIKKRLKHLGTRQVFSYLRMPIRARGQYFLLPEMDVAKGEIFAHGNIETLPESIKVARPLEISYVNRETVESLLGDQGRRALGKVLSIVRSSAEELDWPLERLEIRYAHDPEVEDWEYVLLLLVFTCDFDTADRHLHELYNQIDMLIGKLHDEENEVLRRMIFFDIKTKADISSS